MTSRRALFNGTRAARLLAALRRNGGSAALVAACGFLLPACALPTASAATRVNHAHHSPALSAGRAQAHVVHDEDLRSSHPSSKVSVRTKRHAMESSRAQARNNTETSRHMSDSEGSRHTARTPAILHAGHKHRGEEPIDDPQPVRRADARRSKHQIAPATLHGTRYEPYPAYPEEALHKTPARRSHSGSDLHTSTRTDSTRSNEPEFAATERESTPLAAAPAILPMRSGTPGNVARNLARRKGQGRTTSPSPSNSTNSESSTENLTGTSQPDDDERLSMRSANQLPASFTAVRKQAATAAFAHPPAALATISAPTAQPVLPASGVVQGFGSEVDFRSPAVQLANRPSPVDSPHGTPAEQALELRAAAEVASKPMFVPLYNRDGRVVIPPPLKGSRDILVHQNQMADDAGLTRIQDDTDLSRLRRAHLLVDIEETASLRVNESLPENRRAARPWAVHFANDIANAFYEHFGEALQVNSAVRTVAYQLRLQRTNGNAAAVDGEGASPHLTGQALDFGKRGMTVAEIAWMRSYLMPLIEAGKIDVEEEFQQACFHISVYASYVPAPRRHIPTRTELAQATHTAHTRPAGEIDDNFR